MNQTKKKLYALIVGIDDYPQCPLNGCVADAKKIEAFLQESMISANYEVNLEIRYNAEATKREVTKLFLEHLGQATENDVALFYFSGHGAQEDASETLWHEEGDRKLEGIVCHDSIDKRLLLADKELRYLIHQVASKNPHLLTIFDCCHSGENTRGFEDDAELTKRMLVTARMGNCFPERKWKEFCFHENISQEELKNSTLNKIIPQGNHIQLAACQSDQSAYETNIPDWGKGGVFTYTLLKVLRRSNAKVTYYDLKSRIQNYIKNQFNQTPNIYVKGDDNREIYKSFLGEEQGSQPMYGNVIFNEKRQKWVMDMGAIHGISAQAGTVTVIVKGEELQANIVKVNPADTEIQLSSSSGQPLKKEEYHAYVHPFKSAPIGVFINSDSYQQEAKDLLEKQIKEKGSNINLVSEERLADYTIQLDKWYYAITLPNDPYRPLVDPVEQTAEKAEEILFGHLYHISQWEFTRLLHNADPNSQLNAGAINVEFFKARTDELITIQNDRIDVPLSSDESDNEIKIKLTNTTQQKLHVAVLYLGVNFEVDPSLIETTVQLLEPNGFVWLNVSDENNNIPYYLDDCKRVFNWEESTNIFKLIISTHPFDVNNLLLGPLPDPTNLLETTRGIKGVGSRKNRSANAERWTTRTLTLHIDNPFYNTIDIDQLQKNLETSAAPFLAGLYLDWGDGFSNELLLKENILVVDPDGKTRGLAYRIKLKVANWISKSFRQSRYRLIIKERPDVVRVVSEGDSWFQHPHPKVKDIIDHLCDDYAIYSLGAGGDELINYYNEQEYLFAIEKERPSFLLLSGGGNDLLGAQFKDFLRDDIVIDCRCEKPEDIPHFMKETLFEKISLLGDTYKKIFKDMQERFPTLQTLVHGYDYVIPLDSEDTGWLGRYMIAQNMTRQDDRRQLIKFLLMEFNKMISESADSFPNVHYIDVRDTVAEDRWYDEIHPDSAGFAVVAKRFLNKMEELRSSIPQ